MGQAGRMQYRVIGPDPATWRSVSVPAWAPEWPLPALARTLAAAGAEVATHCDPYVAEA